MKKLVGLGIIVIIIAAVFTVAVGKGINDMDIEKNISGDFSGETASAQAAITSPGTINVTISTDKKVYHPCENMTITINLTNKGEDTFKGKLCIILEYSEKIVRYQFFPIIIKPGEKKTLDKTIHICKAWRKGEYTLRAALVSEENNQTIIHSEDSCNFTIWW